MNNSFKKIQRTGNPALLLYESIEVLPKIDSYGLQKSTLHSSLFGQGHSEQGVQSEDIRNPVADQH